MIIKNILGFCACKGCHKRQQFAIEVKAGNKKKIFKYCEKHAKELMKMGKIKSVTYEEKKRDRVQQEKKERNT